jgi:hypothetical protein
MNSKLLNCLIAGTLATTLALASPALARGGGGGGGGGGGRGGGMGGGMHAGGMGGGMHGGGAHFSGGGAHFGAMSGGAQFSGRSFVGGRSFAGTRFAHAGFSPQSSRSAFHHGHFFHHRFHRFAFVGAPYAYANYDDCWRRVRTPYGLRWANVCSTYGYY